MVAVTFRFGKTLRNPCFFSRILLFLMLVVLTTPAIAQDQDDEIVGVKWNPVNNIVAVQGKNSVWLATPTLQEIARLEPLAQSDVELSIQQVEWSPDGQKLAIGMLGDFFADPTSYGAQIWDITTLQRIVTINDIGVRGFVWSPDGSRLAGGCGTLGNGTCVYNAQDGTRLGQIIPSSYGTVWSPDGGQIVVNSQGFLQIRNASTYELIATIPDEMNSDILPDFSPTENLLAFIGSGDSQTIYIWDTNSMQRVQTLQGHAEYISGLDWGVGGLVSTTASVNGTLRIWDVATGQATTIINTEPVATSWSPDGTILTTMHDGIVEMRDPITGDVIRRMPPYIDNLTLIDVDTGNVLATLSDGVSVDVSAFSTINLAVQANTSPETVGSVVFDLNGGLSIDNNQPYRASLTSGIYTASIETFSSIDGQGIPGGQYALSFTLVSDNQPPIANAGVDQTVTDSDNSGSENVTVDGSGSSDSDGTITSYVWTENSTQIATGATPTVDLAVGTHTITLTVTDDDGATATDEVVITVNAPTSVTCDATVTASDVSGLVSAINTANGSGGADTICLEASTYTLNAVQNNNYGTNGLPAITSEITLVGLGGGATIERAGGSPSFRFFRVTSGGTLTLDNLTLSGGDESNGGAIYNEGTLTLEGTTLQNNTGGRGGGIRNDGGTVTLTDSTLTGNTVTNEGGGVYSTSSLTLTNTTISNNSADDGGGIYNTGGTVNISGGTISGNTVTERGGGIRSFSGGSLIISNGAVIDGNNADIDGGGVYAESTVTITDSTISGNNAVNGGGIYSRSGTLTLLNSTVANNNNDPANPSSVTSLSGGGIYNFAGNVSVTDTLIDDNAVGNDGAGIYNATDTLTVTRSVISNNDAGSRSGGIENRGIAEITLTRIENNTSVSQGGGMFNTGTATITDSCVMGNTSTNSTGVGSSVPMDAEHVWWGDTSGPGGWAGGSGDGIGTSVSALPYLENGCYEPRTSTVIANLSVASSRDYDLHSFQLGARAYTDRTYSFNQVPNELSALIGAVYVRPSQNDKAVSSPADFMTFSLEQNATLYVLWDNRLPTPSWLATWTDTGHDITTTDSGGSLARSVFSQSFNAGQVTLPPPTGTQNSTTYIVVAVPQ